MPIIYTPHTTKHVCDPPLSSRYPAGTLWSCDECGKVHKLIRESDYGGYVAEWQKMREEEVREYLVEMFKADRL